MAVVFYSNSALCFAQTLQIDISFTEVYEEKRILPNKLFYYVIKKFSPGAEKLYFIYIYIC